MTEKIKVNLIIGVFMIISTLLTGAIVNRLMEKARTARIIEKSTLIQMQENCLRKAGEGYLLDWERECLSRGLGSNCSLPKAVADYQRSMLVSNRISCQELYAN